MGEIDRFEKPTNPGDENTALKSTTAGESVVPAHQAALLPDYVIPDLETDLMVVQSVRMPIERLATLGPAAASLLPAFRTITQTTSVDMKGLFRLANAKGGDVLKTAKNGNFWPAFKTEDGLSKLAQLKQAGPVNVTNTTLMPLDPVTIMMAASLYTIEQKLDSILEMQKKILSFLEAEKEAKIEADVKMLSSTLQELKFNMDKDVFIQGHYTLALDVKHNAETNLQAFQKELQNIKVKAPLVANANVNAIAQDMLKKFRYYRMSLYLFSMASFIEILLLGDYREEHILKVKDDIEERSMRYRQIYDDCSRYVEKIAGRAVEVNVLKGLGNAGKTIGGLIGNIPLVKEGPVDEWLSGGGDILRKNAHNMEGEMVQSLRLVSNPETGVFLEKMDVLNRIYNHTSRICFDEDQIYLIEG